MNMSVRPKEEDRTRVPDEMWNSANNIIDYSGIPLERTVVFRGSLEAFRKTRYKSFMDPEPRKIREAAVTGFFEIYREVFKKSVINQDKNKVRGLFLNFAYMDEKLLKPEEASELYNIDLQSIQGDNCSVYTMADWLERIYRQEKDPSVNEFGQDYYEVFREKKKRGELNEEDKFAYDGDSGSRLDHETNNLFKLGQRLCCGQVGSYFPILHSGMISYDLTRSLVSPERIQNGINKVLEVDFSAFHREIVYNQPGSGISKELIMKPVWPEIILVPTYGSRAVMWQELTGRVRSTPARFIFPVFTADNLDNMIIEIMAKFRWELSRTMSSYSRNNETGPSSLVNDYINYIQFYKKNRDLSGEAREKVRVQVEKYRNNVAEIFASDYNTWINFESKGLVRLNKVAREILFRHCPFSQNIRTQLQSHPLYNQLISRYETQRGKQVKFLQAHYAKLTSDGVVSDPDLNHNLMYYNL